MHPEINAAGEPEADFVPKPCEKAAYEALGLTSDQVAKVDVSIGSRTRTATFKFVLTADQVEILRAMVR